MGSSVCKKAIPLAMSRANLTACVWSTTKSDEEVITGLSHVSHHIIGWQWNCWFWKSDDNLMTKILQCNKSQIPANHQKWWQVWTCDQSRGTHWCLHAARCRGSHKASSVWWWWGEGQEEIDMLPTWVGHSGGKISWDVAQEGGTGRGGRQTHKNRQIQRIWHKKT